MNPWVVGDRVQYDDLGSRFTATLLESKGSGVWKGKVDSIDFLNEEFIPELVIGQWVSLIEGHSTKI